MLNNCATVNTIARYQWFNRTGNVNSHHQQEAYKGDEKQWKMTQILVCPVQEQTARADYKSVCMGENKEQQTGQI